jgi:hypothetical protein
VCADFATESEYCAEVDLQHFVPVVVGELVRRVAALDAAAVEEDMYTVAVFEDLWDKCVDRGGRGEVCGVDRCFAAQGFDGLFGGLVGLVTLADLLEDVLLKGNQLIIPEQAIRPHLTLPMLLPLPVRYLWCRLSPKPSCLLG